MEKNKISCKIKNFIKENPFMAITHVLQIVMIVKIILNNEIVLLIHKNGYYIVCLFYLSLFLPVITALIWFIKKNKDNQKEDEVINYNICNIVKDFLYIVAVLIVPICVYIMCVMCGNDFWITTLKVLGPIYIFIFLISVVATDILKVDYSRFLRETIVLILCVVAVWIIFYLNIINTIISSLEAFSITAAYLTTKYISYKKIPQNHSFILPDEYLADKKTIKMIENYKYIYERLEFKYKIFVITTLISTFILYKLKIVELVKPNMFNPTKINLLDNFTNFVQNLIVSGIFFTIIIFLVAILYRNFFHPEEEEKIVKGIGHNILLIDEIKKREGEIGKYFSEKFGKKEEQKDE